MFEDAYNANIAANPVTSRRHAGGEQMTTGVFAEDDWTLGRLVLTGGARADRWTISDGFYRASGTGARSEEHTSELQSLMRISYAVFCLQKKTTIKHNRPTITN